MVMFDAASLSKWVDLPDTALQLHLNTRRGLSTYILKEHTTNRPLLQAVQAGMPWHTYGKRDTLFLRDECCCQPIHTNTGHISLVRDAYLDTFSARAALSAAISFLAATSS